MFLIASPRPPSEPDRGPGSRDRRDHGITVPVGIAVAAVTIVIAELRPFRDVSQVRCEPSLSLVHPDRVIVVSGTHFAQRFEAAVALNQNV